MTRFTDFLGERCRCGGDREKRLPVPAGPMAKTMSDSWMAWR
jgi:hypothetical protein